MMPDFTVVIPAFNEGSQVLRTIRAIRASFDGSHRRADAPGALRMTAPARVWLDE